MLSLKLLQPGLGNIVEHARGSGGLGIRHVAKRDEPALQTPDDGATAADANASVQLPDGLTSSGIECASGWQLIDLLQLLERALGARSEGAGTAGFLFGAKMTQTDQIV